jgi:hypothetical protein
MYTIYTSLKRTQFRGQFCVGAFLHVDEIPAGEALRRSTSSIRRRSNKNFRNRPRPSAEIPL